MLSSCGAVRPATTWWLRRTNSTSSRSRPPKQEVEREQGAGAESVAHPPQPPGDEAHRERLVDRGRLDPDAGWRRHRPVRIAHRPRQRRHLAVVAVAGHLAPDPPDRVAHRQRDGGEVEQAEIEHPAPRRPGEDGDRATNDAAVPDEPGAGEQAADEVVLDLAVVLHDEVDAGADEAADEGRERHLVRVVDRFAELAQPPDEDRAGGDEPAREHDPERLQRDPEDMYLRLHRRGG